MTKLSDVFQTAIAFRNSIEGQFFRDITQESNSIELMPPNFLIYAVQADAQCEIRLYSTEQQKEDDELRPFGFPQDINSPLAFLNWSIGISQINTKVPLVVPSYGYTIDNTVYCKVVLPNGITASNIRIYMMALGLISDAWKEIMLLYPFLGNRLG